MSTIQIRDLPEPAYAILRERARVQGQSLQAYMRELVTDLAFTPTKVEVMAALRHSLATDGGVVLDQDQLSEAKADGRR